MIKTLENDVFNIDPEVTVDFKFLFNLILAQKNEKDVVNISLVRILLHSFKTDTKDIFETINAPYGKLLEYLNIDKNIRKQNYLESEFKTKINNIFKENKNFIDESLKSEKNFREELNHRQYSENK